MDFSLTDMQVEIRNLAQQLLTGLATLDHLKAHDKQGAGLDRSIWKAFVDAGLHSAALPERVGGMGMDFLAVALVCEALGQSVATIPFIPCIASSALPLLTCHDDVVDALLREVAAGTAIITTALIEPDNEDAFAPHATATRHGGQWQVSGTKHGVPYAAESARVLLFATSDDGLWAGLVDPAGPGCRLSAQHLTTNEPTCRLDLDRAPAHGVAQGDAARALLGRVVAMTAVACAAMGVGVADTMMRISGKYTSERVQFGVPVATFQAVAHRLANAYIDVECLKIHTLKAASDIAQGHCDSDAVAMAKIWCGDVLHRVSHTAQHVHGGTGIDRDYHLFRYCLWAKQLELQGGHTQQHLAALGDTLAARYLAG